MKKSQKCLVVFILNEGEWFYCFSYFFFPRILNAANALTIMGMNVISRIVFYAKAASHHLKEKSVPSLLC